MEDLHTTISLQKQRCWWYAVACVSSIWGNGNEVNGAYSVVYDWFQIDTSCHMNGVVRMAFGSIGSIGLEMEIVRNTYGAWQYPPSRSWAHEAMKRSHAHRWWRQQGDGHKRQGLALKDLNVTKRAVGPVLFHSLSIPFELHSIQGRIFFPIFCNIIWDYHCLRGGKWWFLCCWHWAWHGAWHRIPLLHHVGTCCHLTWSWERHSLSYPILHWSLAIGMGNPW